MINDLVKTPNFDKTDLGRRSVFWYNRLFTQLLSLAEYEGLPDSINRDYLECALLTQGSVVWCKDNDGKLRALYGAHFNFDCYMFPTQYQIANPVLGTLSGTFGINGVWMRNNRLAMPVISTISEYAQDIARLDVDFRVNLDNLKLAKVFAVDSDAKAKQVRELYRKVITGEPAVIVGDNIPFMQEPDTTNVFGGDVSYLCTQLLADRRTLINDFLTVFGVNNAAYEKRERLLVDEVNSNNGELAINMADWLDTRRGALDEINALFGTSITVKMKGDDENGAEIWESEREDSGAL